MEKRYEIKRAGVMARVAPEMKEFIQESRPFIEQNERRKIKSDVEVSRILARDYIIHPGMNLSDAMKRLGKFNLR